MISRLAFMHVPKTGGISVETALRSAIDAAEVCPYYYRQEWDEAVAAHPPAHFEQWRLFVGHFTWDNARHLPAGTRLTIVLRDPLDQMLSMYNHIGSRKKHPLHPKVAQDGVGIIELFRQNASLVNHQAKHFLGVERYGEIVRCGKPRAERERLVADACAERLAGFTMLGTTRGLDRFVEWLERDLGRPLGALPHANRNAKTLVSRDQLSDQDRQVLVDLNWADKALSEWLASEAVQASGKLAGSLRT